MIESGLVRSIEDVASQNGIDRSYAARGLRLASLSPGIVNAILIGNERDGLSLHRLLKDMPASWESQKRLFASC